MASGLLCFSIPVHLTFTLTPWLAGWLVLDFLLSLFSLAQPSSFLLLFILSTYLPHIFLLLLHYWPFTSPTWLSKQGINNDDINAHVTLDKEEYIKLLFYTEKTIGYWGNLEVGEEDFSRENHNNLLLSTKWSALIECTQITLYELNRLYLETYLHKLYVHICSCNNN